ncbi:hypothetical protein GQ44DRAFT_825756 [Phaeosphaeriaceae sp. PMI808]|nr:hypothetical protein GQ44DRAFT_825756 [Phaeosphaeriaceae sp. PMI808]
MDHIDTSIEVTHLIRTTILFIQDVVKSSRLSPVISTNLSQIHSFLEAFSDLCFSDVTGLLRDVRISQDLLLDIQKSLNSLNKTLAAHREAWRDVNVGSEVGRQQTVDQRSTISSDMYDRKQSLRDDVKQMSQIRQERTRSGLYSALFEPEEIEVLVYTANAWVQRLRNTLSITFLISDELSPHCPTTRQAANLGITNILERQRRLGLRPSEKYLPLTGQFRKSVNGGKPAKGLVKTVYNDGFDELDVMIEERPYSNTPSTSVRQLTWYLSVSNQSNIETKQHAPQEGYDMLTLACVGYMDDPSNQRSLIVYRSPKSHPWASSPPSLHDLILKGWAGKLGLSWRFHAAKTLATSLLDIHTSGSLHSNIVSSSVAMLPRHLNDAEPSCYLVGWGVDPKSSKLPSLLEPNLYHHRTSFGQTSHPLTTEQDVYSLGVVLLEIGLWTTMSTIFAKLLESTPHFGIQDQERMFKKVNCIILDLAYSPDLQREMGGRYAKLVQKCLEWNRQDAITSMLEFRKQIVDVLEVISNL